jgi:hypothetical protein
MYFIVDRILMLFIVTRRGRVRQDCARVLFDKIGPPYYLWREESHVSRAGFVASIAAIVQL